jgi:hypothetical protein
LWGEDPSAFMIQSSGPRIQTICRPSGDQAGAQSSSLAGRVSCRLRVPLAEIAYTQV